MENKVRIIQQSDIVGLGISPAVCVEWAKDAFLQKDKAQLPAKLSVHPQGEDFITSMPCLLPESKGKHPTSGCLPPEGRKRYFGIKVVSRIEGQTPVLQSSIMLYDALTGQMLAILDGDWITAMRTGAVAALTAKTLQRSGNDTYSMMGLGNIARAVGLCLIDDNRHRQITIRLLRYKDQAEQFIERFKDAENVRFEIVDDGEVFVSGASVLISCVTVAPQLLFPDDSLFGEGMTLIPVHMRGFQNCDLFFDKVFGDDTGQIEYFKYFSRFRQYDEFHHVLQGKNAGRTSDAERILSYNYGLGLHDIFFAARIYELTESHVPTFRLEKETRKTWV